jgi:cytochrome c-type biogenesis protein CcmH/NrfG
LREIDAKIAKIKKKERSADNLNLLGDLHLKKEDTLTAILYFHEAAAVARKDKAIAIYKKVLRLSPSDVPAIQSLINIFAKTGLIAEEIKYLLLLARHYRERGDGQEEVKVYRKILHLDPKNKSAVQYFGKGKFLAEDSTHEEEGDIYRTSPPGDEAETPGVAVKEIKPPESEPVVTEQPVGELPTSGPSDSGPPEVTLMESEPPEGWSQVSKSAGGEAPQGETPEEEAIEGEHAEHGDARIERMPEEKKEGLPARRKSSLWAAAGVVLLILAAGLASYLSREGGRKVGEIQRPMNVEELRIPNTKSAEGNTFKVEVTRLAGDLLREMPALPRLTPGELKENGFFSVTLRAAGGCIPEDLVTSHKNISIIGRDGVLLAPKEMSALAGSTRAFYKEGMCGKGPGIVYARLYVAYPRAVKPQGLLIDGVKIVFEKSTADGYTQ